MCNQLNEEGRKNWAKTFLEIKIYFNDREAWGWVNKPLLRTVFSGKRQWIIIEKKSLKKLDTVRVFSRTISFSQLSLVSRLVIVIALCEHLINMVFQPTATFYSERALRLMCNLLKSSSVIRSRQKASTSIVGYTQYNRINVIIFIHLFGVNICLLFYSSFLVASLESVWFPIVCFHVVLHEKFSFVFMVDGGEKPRESS